MSIDTRSLPPGQYQAQFFLTDPSAPDNFSRAPLADSFSIDGDVIKDDTHYYADQPTLDPVSVPEPINFYLTVTGSPASSDYFFMVIHTPDGGLLTGADGSQWLAWSKLDVNSPTLNLDLPTAAPITAAIVPEPSMLSLLLIAAGLMLLKRSPHA